MYVAMRRFKQVTWKDGQYSLGRAPCNVFENKTDFWKFRHRCNDSTRNTHRVIHPYPLIMLFPSHQDTQIYKVDPTVK